MIYEYGCSECLKTFDIIKPAAEYDTVEHCPICKNVMVKIFSPAQVNMQKLEPHFNHAFGRVIHSKRDLAEHIRREKGEKGREIVEVGNDSLKSVKKQRKEYTID
jgi:putative FmdB family regulatory protein